jgi:hypothetical protein
MTGVAASAAPYYNQAAGCQEHHVDVRIQNQYVTGLPVANSFNLPACGERVTLTIPGLQLITIGTYLWNPLYGYLKVISFDFATSTIIVENECQDGNAAPGTAVPACTLFTVVDSPIGIDNPCTNNAVADGTLMVCKAGVMQPLDATAVGQVPVSLDAGTNEVQFQTLDAPISICTELTSDLGLIIGNAGPYTINVASTVDFAAGDIFIIGGRPDRFVVVNVLSLFQFTATVSPAPVGMDTIPAGTTVCFAPCCEQIVGNLCGLDLTSRFKRYVGNVLHTYTGPTAVTVPNVQSSGSTPIQTITNYTCKVVDVFILGEYKVFGKFSPYLDGEAAHLVITPKFGFLYEAIGGVGVPVESNIYAIDDYVAFNGAAADLIKDWVGTWGRILSINPGNQARFSSSLDFKYWFGAPNNYTVDQLQANLQWIALGF